MPEGRGNERKPLNLALVLDRASLVVCDHSVDVLVPSTPVSHKALFKRAIAEICSRGSTHLYDGRQNGAKQGLIAVDGDYLSRVLLLWDGCANQGMTEPAEIAGYCAEMARAGVSTSTCGLSTHFNEELMVEMARADAGQSCYGESAQDLMDPFQEVFSLLSSLCARNLKLRLSAHAGVKLELLNDYPQSENGSWQLPDVAYDGEVWALVKVTVPADLPSPANGADLEILGGFPSFTDIDTNLADTRSHGRMATPIIR